MKRFKRRRIAYYGAVCWMGLLLSLSSCVALVYAQSPAKVREQQLKAAYLFHFPDFVTWPSTPAARDEVVICLSAQHPLYELLRQAISKQPDKALVLQSRYGVQNIEACQMWYVSAAEFPEFQRNLPTIAAQPVLTISSVPGFARAGGMLEFYLEDNKVRLRANLAALHRAQIRVSSRLLRLVELVEEVSP